MQLEPHVARVREQIQATAALGDDRTREVAAGLAEGVDAATRLALLGAVSEAADEITAALLDQPGAPAVAVRLDGSDALAVEVRSAEHDHPAQPPAEGDTSARVSLRLAESLKSEIDAAAERDGVSVNTWLVRAATTALRQGERRGAARRWPTDSQLSGWLNG